MINQKDMKKELFYIGILLLGMASCEKQHTTVYENNPGLYFYKRNLQGAPDFQNDSIAYSFFVQKSEVMRDTVWIDVRTMGLPEEVARPVKIIQLTDHPETDPVPGEHYVGFDDAEVAELIKVPAGAVQLKFPVIVMRTPSMKTTEYRLHLAIRENEYFGIGLPEQAEFLVKISDKATKPTLWDKRWIYIFGEWGPVKMKFIIDYVGITDFETITGMDTETESFYTAKAIEELEKYNKKHNTVLMEDDGVTIVEFPKR